MIKVIKRDGEIRDYNKSYIKDAVGKAREEIKCDDINLDILIADEVTKEIQDKNADEINVEEIQDLVVKYLKVYNPKIEKAYSDYREKRSLARESNLDIMKKIDAIGVITDRDNANVGNDFSAKMLRIGSESNKWHNLAVMPKKLSKLHINGDLYYHDLDSYNLTTNCLHIPTGKLLQNGFNTGYGKISKPTSILSAGELSCIMLQASQNQCFGGQSHPNFDNDLGKFVESERIKIKKEYKNLEDKNELENIVNIRVHQAMQGVVFNLNTMHSRSGSQVPFSSVNIGLPESEDSALVCQALLEEYEKGFSNKVPFIFPNIIFRVKKGVNREPNDPYYYLYELACRVASKRMNPTFMNIDADFNKEYYDKGILPATMGCRTYLMSNINGEDGVEGRGNIAPVTMNLPRLGIKSMNIKDKKEKYKYFFKILNDTCELCREALLDRYNVLKRLKVRDLPFDCGEGLMKGSEGLNEDDSIEPILKQGTWGIGFIGLAETLIALTGKHHGESKESRELGYKIVSFIRQKTDEFKERDKLNYSTYFSPAEGLSGKFIKKDKNKYGIIKGVTDKDYYTNSIHIPVYYPISIKDKIDIEAPYHKLGNGGHISYVEIDDYPTPQQVMNIINYAYENTNISYMGINFHIRYCKKCGEQIKNHEIKCPKCGNTDIQGISRVTGYMSFDERFGEGKVAERSDRTSANGHKFYNI